MNNKFVLLIAVFTMMLFSSCTTTAQTINVKGTWKLVESNVNTVSSSFEIVKLITDNYCFWYRSDLDGKVYSGAGGPYTLKDNVYTETVTAALPGMTNFLGKQAIYEVKIEGDKMHITGILESLSITEIWQRIDPSK